MTPRRAPRHRWIPSRRWADRLWLAAVIVPWLVALLAAAVLAGWLP